MIRVTAGYYQLNYLHMDKKNPRPNMPQGGSEEPRPDEGPEQGSAGDSAIQ